MYKIKNISELHLEITNKCQASCPMCARNLQGDVGNPFMHLGEITIEQFQQWFDPSFIGQLDKLYMCGNLGDPIIAKDTLKVFEYCRQHNPAMRLSMNTNGSARNFNFWSKLAELKVAIRFGIDGDQNTHSIYRRGTDYELVIKNASAFINGGGEAIWDMLVFEHNSHQVEQCRALSKQLGFSEFVSKNTARFKDDKLDIIDRSGKKVYTIFPTEKSKKLSATEIVPSTISCKVKFGSLYVTAHGIVTPCCWLGIDELPIHNPSRVDYMTRIGKFHSLHENTLEEIFDTKVFEAIESTWSTDPLLACSKQCGKIDKFNEQFQ